MNDEQLDRVDGNEIDILTTLETPLPVRATRFGNGERADERNLITLLQVTLQDYSLR